MSDYYHPNSLSHPDPSSPSHQNPNRINHLRLALDANPLLRSTSSSSSSSNGNIEELRRALEASTNLLAAQLAPGTALAASVSRRNSVAAYNMAPLRLSHDRQSLGISPSLQARFAMREMNDEEDFFGADEFRSLKQALKLDGDGDDGDDGSSSDYEDDFDDAQESRDRSVALSRVPSGKSPSRKLSRHVSGPSGGGLGLLGEAAVGEKTTMKKSGMTMSRSAHFHSYAADDDPPLLSQPKRSGSEIPKAEKKLSLKERLKRVEPTVPRAPKRPPREPSSHAVDRARRADAIVALLDRKREDYREQYRAEVLEHSIRARERVERLGAKSLVKRDAGVVSILPEDRVNELSPPGPPPIMASSDPRKRPPTLPTTHRNPVPPTWTDSRWYKEIVEQMHRPRASHHHQAAVDLDRIASRDVLFGRLLTPGAKEFHIQSKKDHLEPTIIIRRRSPPPINAHGRPSMLKRKRKMIRIVPEISAKSKWKEISVATQQQQQPIPPPPMPSLIRPLCLSKASEEVCAQDQVKFDSKRQRQRNLYRFTRMTDSLIRNRETSLKLLLLHRGTLDGSSDEKEGGYEHEIVYASDDDQDTKDGSRPVTAFGDDRGYDVYIRRTETFAGDIDGMVGQGQGETSKGEDIQTLNRTIVSASRRGAASVRSRGSASSSTTTTTTTAAAGIMFTGPSPIPTTTSTGSRSHPSAQQQQPLSLSTTTTTTTTTTTSTDMLLQSRNLPLDPILSPSIPALNTTSDLTQQGPLPHLPSLDLTEEGGGDLLVPEVGREIISSSPPSPSPSTRRDSQPSSPDSRPSTRTTSSPIPLTLDELVDTHHLKLIDPHVLPRRARWLIPV